MLKTLLSLFLLIPSLSWALTFKNGEIVNKSKKVNYEFLDKDFIFDFSKNISWPEDSKMWGEIETHGRISQNAWNLRYETEIVRDGDYSLRFEMRNDDCGSADCSGRDKAGRSEVAFFDSDIPEKDTRGHLGKVWYAWSIYIPKGTNSIRPAYTIIGQFKMFSDYLKINKDRFGLGSSIDEDCPEIPILFKLEKTGIELNVEGVTACEVNYGKLVLHEKNLHDKWHDFLMHVNWTDKEDGFIKLWVNEKFVLDKKGKTINKIVRKKDNGDKQGPSFRFGIYNGKRHTPVQTQIMYYDSMRAGKKCDSVAIWHDCKNLPKN